MAFYNPPIQQEDEKVVSDFGVFTDASRIRMLGRRILGKRMVTWEHKGRIQFTPEMKTDYQGKVEILAIGPKVKEAKVGEVALIGPYRDLEFGEHVIFQEADIRVIVDG